jgi:hypothetical protein
VKPTSLGFEDVVMLLLSPVSPNCRGKQGTGKGKGRYRREEGRRKEGGAERERERERELSLEPLARLVYWQCRRK